MWCYEFNNIYEYLGSRLEGNNIVIIVDNNYRNSFLDLLHYIDVIMGAVASQITTLTTVYSTVYSDTDQRKPQSSASLAFVRGIHRGPVISPHKWPVTRKMFPFDDVIMLIFGCNPNHRCVLTYRERLSYIYGSVVHLYVIDYAHNFLCFNPVQYSKIHHLVIEIMSIKTRTIVNKIL